MLAMSPVKSGLLAAKAEILASKGLGELLQEGQRFKDDCLCFPGVHVGFL